MNTLTRIGFTFALAALAGLTYATETLNVPLSQPDQPAKLHIDLVNGSIEVIGERRDDMIIEATAREGRQKIVTPSGTVAVTSGSFELDVSEQDNRVKVNSDSWNGAIDIVVRVPVATSLNLTTVNKGAVSVRGVRGLMNLNNVNGPVSAVDVSGSVLAGTVNGDVTVDLSSVDQNRPISLGSVNGDISLSLPDDFNGIVDVDTQSDEIISDFNMTLLPSEPQLQRKGDNQRFTISLNKTIRAQIGNGQGPEVSLETMHGDVSILRHRD